MLRTRILSFPVAMGYHHVVEMATHPRSGPPSAGTRARLLFLFVILALILHVAGRYTYLGPSISDHSIVTNSVPIEQQRLNADVVAWAPPPSELIPFLAAVSTVLLPQSETPYPTLHLDNSLSNRPPPYC